ncbi:hypothetical protein V5O48_009397 [Marasmius crinis-equi]|uniref:Uncharacterized protein n=1 Tax=Marasmius crinis-equi TaxID=585013 RepID=A0ABR3FBE5_9AGAR
MAALYDPSRQVHVIAGASPTLRLPRPFSLADKVFSVLAPYGEKLLLVQAIDREGHNHLLAQLNLAEVFALQLDDATLVSTDKLHEYLVLSPISFSDRRELRKRLEMLQKQQRNGTPMRMGAGIIFARCEYERGRLYKCLALDNMVCERYIFNWDSRMFQTITGIGVAAFYTTLTDDENSVLDVGIAFAKRQSLDDGAQIFVPDEDATKRLKVFSRRFETRQDMEEAEYPLDPSQPLVVDETTIAERIPHILMHPPTSSEGSPSSILLLIDDEEKTKKVLETMLGVSLGKVKRGLDNLFSSISPSTPETSESLAASTVNVSRQRSQSPAPSSSHQRIRDYVYPEPSSSPAYSTANGFTIYLVDVRAMYIGATNLWDDHKWTVLQMASGVGLKVPGISPFWNAAAYAELLLEVFVRLIHGGAIDGKDIVSSEGLPQLSTVHPICSTVECDEFDYSDNGSDEY